MKSYYVGYVANKGFISHDSNMFVDEPNGVFYKAISKEDLYNKLYKDGVFMLFDVELKEIFTY